VPGTEGDGREARVGPGNGHTGVPGGTCMRATREWLKKIFDGGVSIDREGIKQSERNESEDMTWGCTIADLELSNSCPVGQSRACKTSREYGE
jgi:hypothetical protein